VSHPSDKPRDTSLRDDIKELEMSLTWSEIMRNRGYSEDWIAAAVKRRDEKMFADLE